MHFLTYVIGDHPDRALKPLEGQMWDWYATGSAGRWHELTRVNPRKLPLPHYLVRADSSYVERDRWNGEELVDNTGALQRAFDECLKRQEQITVVDVHN
jgi:hypothetical protein